MLFINMSTDHLPKWQKGQPSPNPNGRPPKFITTLKSRDITQETSIGLFLPYFHYPRRKSLKSPILPQSDVLYATEILAISKGIVSTVQRSTIVVVNVEI